jgi:hypothetical protein
MLYDAFFYYYTECGYAECRYAECRGVLLATPDVSKVYLGESHLSLKSISNMTFFILTQRAGTTKLLTAVSYSVSK